jgi:hypothetical protein
MAAGGINVGQLQIVIGANAQPMMAGVQQGINYLQQLRQNVLTVQPAVNGLNNRTRNLHQAFSALIPGIEDFVTVMAGGGGFSMALRSASNNISQATRFLGGLAASFAGIGVVIASVGLPALYNWITGTDKAKEKHKEWMDEFTKGDVAWEKFAQRQREAADAQKNGIGKDIEGRRFDREVAGMDAEGAKNKLEDVREELELVQAKIADFGAAPQFSEFDEKLTAEGVKLETTLKNFKDLWKENAFNPNFDDRDVAQSIEFLTQKKKLLNEIEKETAAGNEANVKKLIKTYENLGDVQDVVGEHWGKEFQTDTVGKLNEELVKDGLKFAAEMRDVIKERVDIRAEENRLLEEQNKLQEKITLEEKNIANKPMWDVDQLFAQIEADRDVARQEFLESQGLVADGMEKRFIDEMKRINEIRQKAVDAGLGNDPATQKMIDDLQKTELSKTIKEQLEKDEAEFQREAPKATDKGGDLIGRDNVAEAFLKQALLATSLAGEQNTKEQKAEQLQEKTNIVLTQLLNKLAGQTTFVPVLFKQQ